MQCGVSRSAAAAGMRRLLPALATWSSNASEIISDSRHFVSQMPGRSLVPCRDLKAIAAGAPPDAAVRSEKEHAELF